MKVCASEPVVKRQRLLTCIAPHLHQPEALIAPGAVRCSSKPLPLQRINNQMHPFAAHDFKAACKQWGLPVSGTKGDLWQRLLDQASPHVLPSLRGMCRTLSASLSAPMAWGRHTCCTAERGTCSCTLAGRSPGRA